MRFLFALLLLLPFRASSASGDILGAFIETNGWAMQVQIEGMATNVVRAFNGFRTNSTPSVSNNIALTLTSMGFNDSGAGATIGRTVYGTATLRRPYPDQALNDCLTNGANGVWVRIALSDYVFSRDSNVVASFRSGAFVNTNAGTASAAASSVTVTNGSLEPYPKVIGNWAWRGWRVEDGPTMDLRAVAFHRSAKDGRPVRLARFWVTDSGGTSVTNDQTVMVIDRTMPDANPVSEYVARFSTNTIASGLVRCNVQFFPWFGDTALDSSTTGWVEPTPHLATLTNAVNYPRVRAIVDATTGDDTTALAYTETAWAGGVPPACLTIGRAMTLIYNTNSSHLSRSGWGGGLIIVSNGNYGWFGTNVSAANGPAVEILIQAASGHYPVITNYAVDRVANGSDLDIYRLKGMTIGANPNNYLVFQHRQAWFDQCVLTNISQSPWMYGTTTSSVVFTHCRLTNVNGGFTGSTLNQPTTVLIRGNTVGTNVETVAKLFVILGNLRNHPGPSTSWGWQYDASSQVSPRSFPMIFAYNKTFNSAGTIFNIPEAYSIGTGAAIVQNVFESGSTDAGIGYVLGADDATIHMTNVMIWHNVFASKRAIRAYNETGSGASYSVATHWNGNIWDWAPHKDDTYGTPNGSRIGGWPVSFGAGSIGNLFGQTTNISSVTFFEEFSGLQSYNSRSAQNTNYWRPFVRGGYDGTRTNAPGGDYRILSDSPLHRGLHPDWVLPYDLDGAHRGKIDPPGAFVSGNRKKGLF